MIGMELKTVKNIHGEQVFHQKYVVSLVKVRCCWFSYIVNFLLTLPS